MAEMTRISKTHITAIENEDVAKLPADVYVRGYVYQYAKVLKLEPERVATSYLLHFKKLKSQK
jgi:cytoskeletal protein RodZ